METNFMGFWGFGVILLLGIQIPLVEMEILTHI
jgi:hypothetical protein